MIDSLRIGIYDESFDKNNLPIFMSTSKIRRKNKILKLSNYALDNPYKNYIKNNLDSSLKLLRFTSIKNLKITEIN